MFIIIINYSTMDMGFLPRLNENEMDLLVAYSLSSEEAMVEGVVNSFYAANIDVFEKPTQLYDWVNPDVFTLLQWSSNRPIYLSTRIWDHQVVITSEEIRIYRQSFRI